MKRIPTVKAAPPATPEGELVSNDWARPLRKPPLRAEHRQRATGNSHARTLGAVVLEVGILTPVNDERDSPEISASPRRVAKFPPRLEVVK